MPGLVQLEWAQASLLFTTIMGRNDPEEAWTMFSAFPVLTRKAEWIVQVERALDSYGAIEGAVQGLGWLQGTWKGAATDREMEEWEKAGGEALTPGPDAAIT